MATLKNATPPYFARKKILSDHLNFSRQCVTSKQVRFLHCLKNFSDQLGILNSLLSVLPFLPFWISTRFQPCLPSRCTGKSKGKSVSFFAYAEDNCDFPAKICAWLTAYFGGFKAAFPPAARDICYIRTPTKTTPARDWKNCPLENTVRPFLSWCLRQMRIKAFFESRKRRKK